jgi:hypothetical protein
MVALKKAAGSTGLDAQYVKVETVLDAFSPSLLLKSMQLHSRHFAFPGSLGNKAAGASVRLAEGSNCCPRASPSDRLSPASHNAAGTEMVQPYIFLGNRWRT